MRYHQYRKLIVLSTMIIRLTEPIVSDVKHFGLVSNTVCDTNIIANILRSWGFRKRDCDIIFVAIIMSDSGSVGNYEAGNIGKVPIGFTSKEIFLRYSEYHKMATSVLVEVGLIYF